MKILNNFDTELKNHEYEDAVKTFWKSNVILIQRCFAYWVIKWIIPLVLYVVLSTIILIILYSLIFKEFPHIFRFFLSVWIIGMVLFLYRILMKYIDYTMDFTIVTPAEILTHKQFWIRSSDYKNFPSKNIRSVSSAREWFLWNIFWYGYILFLTDWSVTDAENWRHWPGKILLTYVHRPNENRKRIMNLCVGDENTHYFKVEDTQEKK